MAYCFKQISWTIRSQSTSSVRTYAQGRANATRRGAQLQKRNGRVLNDVYFRDAKREGYLSRAAFKLLQLDDKYHVIAKGGNILDLGCFPGAWLQVACQRIGPRSKGGAVLGLDLKEMARPKLHCDDRVTVIQGDAYDVTPTELEGLTPGGFHTVLSDMCHSTSGSAVADVARSLQLCEWAAIIALGHAHFVSAEEMQSAHPDVQEGLDVWRRGVLRRRGALVMKILEGEGTREFAESLRPAFDKVAFFRPKATRSESREVYIVCCGKCR